MFKKVVSLIMVAAIAASLAACGNATKSTKSEGSSGTEQAGTSTDVKWPKNVEIVVPAGAGGDTDFNARLLADKLGKKISGVNFVVSNVNGNGGATGTRQVKNAKNDGSSVVFYHTALLVNKASKATDYGFESFEFACIAAQNVGNVLTIRSNLGIKSLDELKKYTEEHPGELKMAAQTGATSYAIAMQMKNAGFNINVVDAGSAADRLAAIVGGHVDLILSAYGSVKDYIQQGELIPLAMDGENDLVVDDQQIDVKAFKNQGFENINLPFYYFFAFPKGTDTNLVNAFDEAVSDIVNNDSDYQQKIYESYYQKPFFQNAEDGLKTHSEIDEMLSKIDLTGKVSG